MGQGAFTTQVLGQSEGHTAGASDLLEKLRNVAPSNAGNGTQKGTQERLTGIDALAKMTAPRKVRPAQDAPNPEGNPGHPAARPDPAPVPAETGFVPGKPGAPKSGMTVHQMMKDPDVLTRVQDVVSKWEQENPNRVLKGPHIKSGLDAAGLEVSHAQATKLAKRIMAEHEKLTIQQVASYLGKGARKVMS
jgi:hypothetical protein